MHELAVAQGLLEIIEAEARPYKGARVTRVMLRIGKLSTVVPEALRFAFEVVTKGGIAEGAILQIEEVPTKIHCHVCQETFITEDPFLICPKCGGCDCELVSGRELEIEAMEIDDGDKAGQRYLAGE